MNISFDVFFSSRDAVCNLHTAVYSSSSNRRLQPSEPCSPSGAHRRSVRRRTHQSSTRTCPASPAAPPGRQARPPGTAPPGQLGLLDSPRERSPSFVRANSESVGSQGLILEKELGRGVGPDLPRLPARESGWRARGEISLEVGVALQSSYAFWARH